MDGATPLASDAPALAELMRAHADSPWLFVSPGGNWGDHLIYAGADALAARQGVRRKTVDGAGLAVARTSPGEVIYLHGSGGFNGWGSGRAVSNLIAALDRRSAIVIQGPHSFADDDPGLVERIERAVARRQCGRLVLLARERASLSVLRSMNLPDVEIGVDHDTALSLTREDLLSLAGLDDMPRPRYDLTIAREDAEAPAAPAGPRRRGVTLDPAYVAVSLRHWLRIHLFARSILSNRLHSAIAAAIAGIPVTLADGAYHKNRSVYEFSLAARGVLWTDSGPGRPVRPPTLSWDGLRRRSWKLGRLWLLTQRIPLD